MTRTNNSGVDTTFKDKDGKSITVHCYVKDAEGNRYFINSHCQAVPEGSEAPAVELATLIANSEVTVMDIEEVLNMKREAVPAHRGRGGRRRKATSEEGPKEAPDAAPAPTEDKKPGETGATAAHEDLQPVDKIMLLSVVQDDELASELRRRGYMLCAFKPALIEL